MADKNFRVKHGINIDTERLVDVNRNIVAGVTTFAHTRVTGIATVGIISATNGAGGMGIVTFQSQIAIESGGQRITITPPSQTSGFVSSFTLTLPAKPGTDGQVLTYGPDGVLGFTTNGLYENRYYVSSANGDDNNDGRSKPFKTIKKAAQAASFRSFQLPGGRYIDAGNLLTANRQFIQEEVVSYLEFNFPNIYTDKPDYDRAICIRDVGYIVDAIAYDLSYSGNSKSVEAGLAYWSGGVSYVQGEESEALFAYNYIKFLAQYVINNQTPPTLYQNVITQTFDFTITDDPANVNANRFHRSKDARNLIVNNRQEIIDKSLAAVAIAHSDFYFPNESSTNARSRYYDAYRLIQQNRQTIIDYSYAGIATAYPAFVNPNPNKCKRDLGYFIDAISTDVFTGGNNYAREFVLKYFTGVGIGSLAGEEQQTIYAFRYAGDLMREAITNRLPIQDLTVSVGSTTYGGIGTANEYNNQQSIAFDILFNQEGDQYILNAQTIPSNTSPNACFDVQTNIVSLVGIVTSVIGAGNTTSLPTYNGGYFAGITTSCNVICGSIGIGSTNIIGGRKCARDLGYIVDAIAQDISYQSNQHIIYATKAYFDGAGVPISNGLLGEQSQSVTAFQAARDYAKLAITNQLNYQDLTIIADPLTGFNTSPSSCANVRANIDSLVGILTAAITNGNLSSVPATGIGATTDCANVRSAIVNSVGIITSIIGIGTTAAPALSLPTTLSRPICIFVEAGDYVEDNPVLLYDDVAVVGDNLRNTIIRPQNAGKDLFRVRKGCYVTGFAMKDYIDAAGVPQYTFDYAVAFDDPLDTFTSRIGYAVKTDKPAITRSPYIQNCSILSFLGANGILVDGAKIQSPNVANIPEEGENPVSGGQPQFGKSMVAAAFTMVSFGGIGWRTINDGYAQVVSCFQIFCKYGSLTQSGGYLSITNSATNFGLYALRSSGFNERSYVFDRGRIAATGTSSGAQTLRTIGLGRTDQDLYVLRFFDNAGNDDTADFKPVVTQATFQPTVGLNTATDRFTVVAHPFLNGDTVLYLGDENAAPQRVIEGMVSGNQYYLGYIDANTFQLYEDDALTRLVNTKSRPVGINTFQKGNVEFFASEILDSHHNYQIVSLASTTSSLNFVSGRQITQLVPGGTAVGYAYTYNSTKRELVVSVESSGGVTRLFGVTDGVVTLKINDHSGSPVSIAVTGVVGVSTYYTVECKVGATIPDTVINGVGNLPETYKLHFHRPSIINSSSHTWEFSGSGTDYNALPENGGKTITSSEQLSELGGRVYSSGTNELGDFKIGSFITAYNRTGNIVFNNKVTIGQLDSLRLSLSGGVAVEEFSTDIGLGDNEIGGPQNKRVSTQLAVRTFLNNRLGSFIDKSISTNAVPSAIVQLNSNGQINPDLIPPKVVNYYTASVSGGRTDLVNRIPAINLQSGDTVLEPASGYVLTNDLYGQYLILSSATRNYNYLNGDEVIGTNSAGGAIGIITAPPSNAVGYGTTGLVKGVLLSVSITSGGSGYTNPGIYTCVLDRTTGIGTSARAAITVGASGTVTAISVNFGGRAYTSGDILTINNATLLGGRTGGANFTATVSIVETRLYLRLTNNQKFTASTSLPDYITDRDAVGVGTSLQLQYQKTFTPTDISIGGAIDFTNNRIVVGLSTFTNGDPVIYSSAGGNVIGGLTQGDTYYVKRVGLSSVELYTTYGLSSLVTLTGSGTGTHSLTRVGVNTSDDFIVFEKHGFASGDAVRVTGATPVGVTTGAFYFVGSVVTNAFTLHSTRADAITSVNGSTFSPVGLGSTATGTVTFTKQNVQYNSTVNTSSSILDNWSVLATSSVDAANITSGTISPTRLGSGSANSDTFLRGDSSFDRVVTRVGIGTTEPLSATASFTESAPGGVGVNTYIGKVNLSIQRVKTVVGQDYTSLGVSRFKTSTFSIGSDGEVSIKNSSSGDIDAASLGGQAGSYYLNPVNFTSSIPISKGGTGLAALPPAGAILQGNGTSYDLVTSPTLSGNLTLTVGGYFRAVGLAVTHGSISGFGTITNLESTNTITSGIATFSGSANNINQTAGTAALNRLTVTGVSTFNNTVNVNTITMSDATNSRLTNAGTIVASNQTVSGVVTFSGSANNINCTSGTQVFNRAVFSGITTFLSDVNVGVANYQTATVAGTLTAGNFSVSGISTLGRVSISDTLLATTLTVSGVTTFSNTINTQAINAASTVSLTLPNILNTNTVVSGITTFNSAVNNIVQTAGTAALNRLTVTGISTFTGQVNYGTLSGTTLTNSGTAILTDQTVSGVSTFSGSGNNINQTAGTAALNRLTVTGISTFTGQLNAGTISATTLSGSLGNTLTINSPLTGSSYNNSAAVNIGINATSANTANFVVQRGASGEFSAGAITATNYLVTTASSTEASGVALQRVFNKTVNAGQLYRLAEYEDTEGDVAFEIQVSSETGAHSGTSIYRFQGGFNILTGSYYRLYPYNTGNGHGDGADTGLDSNAWNIFIYGSGVTGSSTRYGIAVHVPAGRSNKVLVTTVTELKRGMTFTDQSALAVITSFTNSGNVYPNKNLFIENRIGVGKVPTTAIDVNGTVTATTFAGSGASLTSIPNSATTATSANTINAIVARDGSGNFSAGTITATLTGDSSGLTSFDTRATNPQPQSYSASLRIDFKENTANSLSDGGTYNGVLSWRKYGSTTDFSGGPMLQLAYTDNGNLWRRLSSGTTTWGTWAKFWHDANDGSGSGLDADLLDGLNLSTDGSANTSANIIPRTNASGDIGFATVSTNVGILTNTTNIDRVYVGNDNAIRRKDINDFKEKVGLTYKYFRPRSSDTTDTNYWTGVMGWNTTDLNNVFDWGSGFVDTWGSPGNAPSGTTHWVGTQAMHYTNNSTRYGWQQLVGAGDPSLHFIRGVWGGGFTSWRRIWNEGNDGSGSGLDADLLDGLNSASTNTVSTIVARDASGGFAAAKVDTTQLTRTNARVDTAERYPIGHYSQGEAVFELDPTWTNAELQNYFNFAGVSWVNDSTAPGGYAVSITGQPSVGGEYTAGFPYIPVDTNDIYYMECYIRNVTGTNTHYMGSIDYNEAFTSLGGNPGSFGYWVMSNTNPGTAWTKVSGYITGFGAATGQFKAGTKYWTPMALFNYTTTQVPGSSAVSYISGWKVFRVSHFGNRTITGNFTASGNVTANSDIKLKTNIKPIENALEKVTKMRGVEFDRIDRDNEHQIGVIAQEIEEVIPEVVSDNYGTKAVAYGNITAVLIEAIKEQQVMINNLKAEIEELKKK